MDTCQRTLRVPACTDVREILQAGVWLWLWQRRRAAMRRTCRDARATADMMKDTDIPVLLVSPGGDDPATLAAFHARLGSLRVLYAADQDAPAGEQWLQAYRAACTFGPAVRECKVAEAERHTLHAAGPRPSCCGACRRCAHSL